MDGGFPLWCTLVLFPHFQLLSLSLGGIASVSISVLDIDVINLTDIIAVIIIITVIYLLLLLV